MNEFTYISLGSIWECERKALAKAAVEGTGDSFMRGIINMVSEIEGKMLDDEAEREAAKGSE